VSYHFALAFGRLSGSLAKKEVCVVNEQSVDPQTLIGTPSTVNTRPATTPPTPIISYDLIKQALQEVLDSGSEASLTKKFSGGKVLIQPANKELQAKEIPIDEFFKKIIRVRDQLRVLEQKINNHGTLSESDKVSFQSYITRSYGALTSFNILFKDKDDQFRGQSGK
jgi:hypothetical protein